MSRLTRTSAAKRPMARDGEGGGVAGAGQKPASPPSRAGASRDPRRTAAAILAAAVKEFAEHGYGGARIDNIAKRAGANKRMLYHYFGNKEALYVAVLENTFDAIRTAELSLRLPERDPAEGIAALVRFTWRYYLAHPEFLSLIAIEDMNRARHLKRSTRILDLNSPLVPQLAALIERGVVAGTFRPGLDPLTVYLSIAAMGVFYLAHRWTLSTIFDRDLKAPEQLEAWERHMIEATLASVRHVPTSTRSNEAQCTS